MTAVKSDDDWTESAEITGFQGVISSDDGSKKGDQQIWEKDRTGKVV